MLNILLPDRRLGRDQGLFKKRRKQQNATMLRKQKLQSRLKITKLKLRWVNIRTGKYLKTEITDAGEMVHKLGAVAALP